MKKEFSGQLTISMDGLRRNLVDRGERLKEAIIASLDIEDYPVILDAFDELACSINCMNCVYSNEISNFSDMSDEKEIRHFSDDYRNE